MPSLHVPLEAHSVWQTPNGHVRGVLRNIPRPGRFGKSVFIGVPCIFRFVLLGSFEKDGQAGVIRPVATGRMTVRVGTFVPGIRFDVMRPGACFTRAHCPKLEPLFEHDNSKIIVARILQV
jgi:hypothetical protein